MYTVLKLNKFFNVENIAQGKYEWLRQLELGSIRLNDMIKV